MVTARAAVDPAVLVAFLDERTTYLYGGTPPRLARCINARRVSKDVDARTIRRWRHGHVKSVAPKTVTALLERYGLTVEELEQFAASNGLQLMLRGTMTKETA